MIIKYLFLSFATETNIQIRMHEIIKPDHYDQGVYSPIAIIEHYNLNFSLGNNVKYVLRAGKKKYAGCNEIESALMDLKKAKQNLEFEINRLERVSLGLQ